MTERTLNDGEDLSLYDDPEVQREFVRGGPGGREAVLLLEGLHCAGCALRNEDALLRVPGVLAAEVNYATHRATVRWDASRARLSAILAAIRRIGYRAYPHDPRRADVLDRRARRDALGRLAVAGLGAMQVMMYALPAYIAGDGDMSAGIEQLLRWASFALTLPVVLYSGAPFFRGALRDLRGLRLGMDVPVALGIAVAFGASLAATIVGAGEVYFDSVAMFVFLLLLGRYLGFLGQAHAARALQHLGRLVPEFAHRLRAFPRSLDAEHVAAAVLKRGDHVLVKPGETFPADGTVVDGSGRVSEALLSGEADPKLKRGGDAVIAGAVNLATPLVVRVERTGPHTVLSSILRLVERAAAEKPRMVAMADRAAGWFIALVLALAAIAGLYWAETEPSRTLPVVVAVLVASCPCALSLATPVALTVAIGELAARGVVVARQQAIEGLARATDVVLDKTGTLTRGEPRLAEVLPLGTRSASECLAIAAALESASEHPIGRAIVAACGEAPRFSASAARSVPGMGVEARVEGAFYRLGTAEFAGGGAQTPAGRSPEASDSLVWLGDGTILLAAMRVADLPRTEATEAVAALQRMGLTVHLLSGDGEGAVQAAARRSGVDAFRAQADPDAKRRYAAELQRRGRTLAMVGDGVNDAPVLAQADVSLAMGGGARVAQISADAVLVTDDLRELARAFAYARRTVRIVRQNIAWAFAYNLLVLPLALAGWLAPWAAAAGMSASSLLVVVNALRLQSRSRRSVQHAAVPAGAASPV